MKLTRNVEARIRYQLYRDAGYSIKDAQRLRYIRNPDNPEYLDIKSIKVDRTTKKVIKKTTYRNVRNVINVDDRLSVLRDAKNDSVYTMHGFLTNKPTTGDTPDYKFMRNEYHDLVMSMKKYDNLNNDQAYFMAHFMLLNKVDYHTARRELLSNQDFQKYVQSKRRGSVRIKGYKTTSRSRNKRR